MIESADQFRKRILERFDSLPPQQKLVAEYVLDHVHEVAFLHVPEIAKRSGVSEATVVRFAQRIGYDGLAELKAALVDALRQRMDQRSASPGIPAALEREPDEDTPAAIARLEVENIRQTMAGIERATFENVASTIFRADHVYTFGLGISNHMASLMSYLLTQIGLRSTQLSTGYSSPAEQLVCLRATDLLVTFSFPPYSRRTVDLVREATSRGVSTLAICDRRSSPAARLARLTLMVRSDNLMFTNSFAAISALLNALTTEIALRNREHIAEAVSRISRILEDDAGLIDG
jgi:DNA-binding MurR/RpiR family transcriptional regulator